MKNLKLALVSVVLAMAVIGTATADGIHAKPKTVSVSFEKAITIPGLVKAMYEQLDPGFLKVEQKVYTCKVRHDSKIYLIKGTRLQWVRFFKLKPKNEVPTIGFGTP